VKGAGAPPAGERALLRLPDQPLPAAKLKARLARARTEDWSFAEGRIFGSMCTEPLPEAVEASHLFTTANLGNPGLCPGTARLEEEVVAILLELFHAPAFGAGGRIVSGGTEANLTALWVARNFTGGKELVLPRSAHFSLAKAADLLGLRPRWVPLTAEGQMDLGEAKRALGKATAALVGVAGSTELGVVDPLEELAEMALAAGVPLHVDAAFGGYVLPFLKELGRPPLPFDFSLPGVTSLTVDPHKMGMAPVPAGALLLRNVKMLSAIEVASPYLSAPLATSLLGTRASQAVAASYAAMVRLGRTGYRDIVSGALLLTGRLLDGGIALGLRPIVAPTLNIVAFHHANPLGVQAAMLKRRWDVSATHDPPGIRFVVMPHARRETVDALLRDLATVLREFPAEGSPVR
jgi:tyrosine decarboxylase/aspartate 1-decarboxylase